MMYQPSKSHGLDWTRASTAVLALAIFLSPGAAIAQEVSTVRPEFGTNAAIPQAKAVTFAVSSFELDDQAGIERDDRAGLEALLRGYAGPERRLEDAISARRAAQKHLDDRHAGQFTVMLPEQTLVDGKIRLTIVRAAVRKINVVTARQTTSYDEANVRRTMPSIVSGRSIDLGNLRTEIAMADLNPLKRTSVALSPRGDDQVDVTIAGTAPLGRFVAYVNADNFGPVGSRGRLGLGLVDANLTGRDDVLSVNGIVAATPSKMWAVSGGYSLPIYSAHTLLELSASHSESDSGQVSIFSINGSGTVLKAKATHFAGSLGPLAASVSLAYEYRHSENSVLLTAAPQFGSLVPSASTAPVTFGVNLNWNSLTNSAQSLRSKASVNFGARVTHNFAGSLGSSSAVELDKLRSGAGSYTILGANLSTRLDFSDWLLVGSIAGQWTSSTLIAMDQIGIAGPYAVRGFGSASVLGDKGYVANLELSTPNLISKNGLRLYSFADFGGIGRNNALPSELKSASLGSAGAGARLSIVGAFSVDAYWAHKLKGRAYDADIHPDTFWVSLSGRF